MRNQRQILVDQWLYMRMQLLKAKSTHVLYQQVLFNYQDSSFKHNILLNLTV